MTTPVKTSVAAFDECCRQRKAEAFTSRDTAYVRRLREREHARKVIKVIRALQSFDRKRSCED